MLPIISTDQNLQTFNTSLHNQGSFDMLVVGKGTAVVDESDNGL